MANSLLGSDQNTSSLIGGPTHGEKGEIQLLAPISGSRNASRSEFTHASLNGLFSGTLSLAEQVSPIVASSHINRRGLSARHALRAIANLKAEKDRKGRLQKEMAWIEANRTTYAGRWVALVGDRLLSVGASAGEVFRGTRGSTVSPLIVHVEPKLPPFMGW
jgi:hypothetical protein